MQNILIRETLSTEEGYLKEDKELIYRTLVEGEFCSTDEGEYLPANITIVVSTTDTMDDVSPLELFIDGEQKNADWLGLAYFEILENSN